MLGMCNRRTTQPAVCAGHGADCRQAWLVRQSEPKATLAGRRRDASLLECSGDFHHGLLAPGLAARGGAAPPGRPHNVQLASRSRQVQNRPSRQSAISSTGKRNGAAESGRGPMPTVTCGS